MKKPFYKRKGFIALIIILVLLVIIGSCGGDSEDSDNNESTKATTEATTTEETTEPTTEAKSEEDIAYEMGQNWFSMIDWDSVFKYKSDVHYIMDYRCQEVTSDDLKEYGKYVAMAGADLQNGFGAEFTSTVYIFMDKDGIAKHVFYDEADGTSTEIPMDSIPTSY